MKSPVQSKLLALAMGLSVLAGSTAMLCTQPGVAETAGSSRMTASSSGAKATQSNVTAASSSNQLAGQFQKVVLPSGGHERNYYLYVPSSYRMGQKMPLLLVFHGYLGSGPQMMKSTGFNELAEREGFIVAYPEALTEKWNAKDAPSDSADTDVRFVGALLDTLQSLYSIQPERIYATGFSSGGFFTQRLACEMSDRIAAFAPVAATFGRPLAATCAPARPVPILMTNGTSDPIVTWQGQIKRVKYAFKDSSIMTVPEAVAFWRQRNQCAASPRVSLLMHAARAGTGVQINEYPSCREGSAVEQVIIEQGGHTWPGSRSKGRIARPLLGRTSQDIDLSEVIWTFFQQHPMPGSASR